MNPPHRVLKVESSLGFSIKGASRVFKKEEMPKEDNCKKKKKIA
jgi:hypothetical protein